jgi:hypothetical protein
MITRKQAESVLAILLLLLIIARWQRSWYFVYAAGGVLLLAFAWPRAAEWLSVYWMKLGKLIGLVTGKILLFLIFLFIVIPLSFFVRWRGKLDMRMHPGKETNFKERDHVFVPDDLKEPW